MCGIGLPRMLDSTIVEAVVTFPIIIIAETTQGIRSETDTMTETTIDKAVTDSDGTITEVETKAMAASDIDVMETTFTKNKIRSE